MINYAITFSSHRCFFILFLAFKKLNFYFETQTGVRGNTPNHPKTPQTTSKPPQTTSKPSQTTFLTPKICFCDSINNIRRNLKAFLLRWPAMLAPNHHQTTQTTSKPPQTTFLTPRLCFCDSINKWRRNLKAYVIRWPAMLAPNYHQTTTNHI